MALEITDKNAQELIASGKPVVIDLWAPWCGPCRMVAPIIEELATEYDGRAIIGKYNVDEESDLSTEYSVRNKEGKLVDKQVGASPKTTIEDRIKALL